METNRIVRTLIILVVLSTNIGCDQISKNIARQKLEYHQPISLIKNYVMLIKVENTGAFLSFGQSLPQPIKILILTIIPLFVLGFAASYLLKRKHLTSGTLIGISFMVGGGVGNIYDRITYGSVTDFLYIDIGYIHSGIFNLADVSIMIGTLIILSDSYFGLVRLDVPKMEDSGNK